MPQFPQFIKVLKKLLKVKYILGFPDKKKTIVLDLDNSYYFKKLFKNKKTHFLDTRYNEFNLVILIYTVFKYFFNYKKNLLQQYIINYLHVVKPKNIVTFTDNNIFFLSLKNIFKKTNLIVIQYAWRNRLTFDEMYKETRKKNFKKFKVDYTCIWGDNSKNFFSKFVDTNYVKTGSIKNNFFKYKKKLREDTIVFISQFRMPIDYDAKKKTYINNVFKENSLKYILKYCKKNNLKLKILGWAMQDSNYEINYFNNILGKKNYSFLQRERGLSAYEKSANYKYFISFCSSLAYELISRGKRAAFLPSGEGGLFPDYGLKENFFNKNKKIKFDESFYSKKKIGPMWSNLSSKKEIFRILDYILKTKKNKWENIKKKLINTIIIYDKENIKLKKLFDKVGIN